MNTHDNRPEFCHSITHHEQCQCDTCMTGRIDRNLQRVVKLLESQLPPAADISPTAAKMITDASLKLKSSTDALSAAVRSQSPAQP